MTETEIIIKISEQQEIIRGSEIADVDTDALASYAATEDYQDDVETVMRAASRLHTLLEHLKDIHERRELVLGNDNI